MFYRSIVFLKNTYMHVHMRYVKSAIFTRAEYRDFEALWHYFLYMYVYFIYQMRIRLSYWGSHEKRCM